MSIADPQPRFVKIVRTKIARALGSSGSSMVIYKEASDEQLIEGLRKKLIEEAAEYLVNPSIDELADIIEVVKALAHYDLKLGPTAFVRVLNQVGKKRDERGGFEEGMAMFLYSPPLGADAGNKLKLFGQCTMHGWFEVEMGHKVECPVEDCAATFFTHIAYYPPPGPKAYPRPPADAE